MKNIKVSHWNYRVLEITRNNIKEYGIIEVYYDKNNKPVAYTDYQIPWGESLSELKYETSAMLKACRYDVLTEEDFKKKKKGKKHVKPLDK